jgi:peroxiredoxin Q/BCP
MNLSAEPLEIGSEAPALKVKIDSGDTIDLAEAYGQGAVLVYFYPRADTPGCTKQACNLRDHYAALQDAGITVFGVSTDEVEAQKAFKVKFNLPFTLIADPKAKLVDAFGVPKNGDFARRQAFLIKGAKIVWRDLEAKPATQAEDALAALAGLGSAG